MRSALTDEQGALLDAYAELLLDANERVNLVSRRSSLEDIQRHIDHSLMLARKAFPDGAEVADFGTGGGLPGIPLAIAFPGAQFTLIDSTRKKTALVEMFVRELHLENAHVWTGRAEDFDRPAHYAVSRATAPLSALLAWFERVRQPFTAEEQASWEPGVLCLKGGDLSEEIEQAARLEPHYMIDTIPLESPDEWFLEKVIVHAAAPS